MKLRLSLQAQEDLDYWVSSDPELASRIRALLERLEQGQDLPALQQVNLKFREISLTSVKIAPEHRLVFEPSGEQILVHQCRFHY
jgi:toxin YoeB